jgi:diadenylate cyclase
MLLQVDLLRSLFDPLISGNYSPWVVAVELLLIGVPVYVILRFLRGTRGARLVWAVGLILVVSFLLVRLVARKFELDRINYLYPSFVLSIALIALVVFQPELRRGLMRIGERGWFRSWSKSAAEVIDPIVSAVGQLSKKKIGALIAIERTTSLGGVSESGVSIDAAVSAELIETIFWPGSALHDMGMIVEQGRIVAAGCQFPLADSEDVDRSLGSRHRAAVGMSHECDAVVIVVSEETGTISVAQRGRLRRSLSTDSLRSVLVEAFSPQAPKTPERSPQTAMAPSAEGPAEQPPSEKVPVSEPAALVEAKQSA